MTVFLAIDLGDDARARVEDVVGRFRTRVDARWVRADKLHLTVVFLGSPLPAQVQVLTRLVDGLAARHRPFSLFLRGAGTFGTARAPSVLWLGVEGERRALEGLQVDARQTLLFEGLPGVQAIERERPYVPHVTLARSKSGQPFGPVEAALRDFATPSFRVTHLTLYESATSVYRPLHRAPLTGVG